MSVLSGIYRDAGQFENSLALDEETLRLSKAKLGPEHPDTFRAMNNVASMYWGLGKLEQSIPLFEETLRLSKRVRGEDHPETIRVIANLGANYLAAGRLDEALPLFEEAFKKVQEKHASNLELTTLLYVQFGRHLFTCGPFR